jgi:hypothetical protein
VDVGPGGQLLRAGAVEAAGTGELRVGGARAQRGALLPRGLQRVERIETTG